MTAKRKYSKIFLSLIERVKGACGKIRNTVVDVSRSVSAGTGADLTKSL